MVTGKLTEIIEGDVHSEFQKDTKYLMTVNLKII